MTLDIVPLGHPKDAVSASNCLDEDDRILNLGLNTHSGSLHWAWLCYWHRDPQSSRFPSWQSSKNNGLERLQTNLEIIAFSMLISALAEDLPGENLTELTD